METRSSPSMCELRAVAHERGLKYYLHLSKPELFALLQRKHGGGAGTQKPRVDSSTGAELSGRSAAVSDSSAVTATALQSSDAIASSAAAPPQSSSSSSGRVAVDAKAPCPKATRSSARLSQLKRKATALDEEGDDPRVRSKKHKVAINSLDPIMMCELGPHTVRRARAAFKGWLQGGGRKGEGSGSDAHRLSLSTVVVVML